MAPPDPVPIAHGNFQGVTMLDAPVSGGVPGAENATLTFIVGGTEEGMDRARPLLLSMGAQTVHCGEAGSGCIAKVRCMVETWYLSARKCKERLIVDLKTQTVLTFPDGVV